jgi:hypothetical protein
MAVATDPFPLVPAMCIVCGNFSWGLLSLFNNSFILFKDKLISLG